MQSCKRAGIIDSIVRRATPDEEGGSRARKREAWRADPEIKLWLEQRGVSNEKRQQAAEELGAARNRVKLDNLGLREIHPELMKLPVSATRLSLANNNFHAAPALGSLGSLTHLDLSSNLLERIPETEIGVLRQLKSLNLARNDIKVIPHQIGNLSKLEVLDVSENSLGQLTQGHALPDTIGHLAKLRKLDLQGNLISQMPVQLKGLARLEKLDISSNHFRDLPIEVAQLDKLHTLNVANNDLRSMPQGDVGGGPLYKSLAKLNVSGNPLTWLPGDFGPLKYVSISKLTVTKLGGGASLVITIANTPLPHNTMGARLPVLTGKDVPPQPQYLPLYKAPLGIDAVRQGRFEEGPGAAPARAAMPYRPQPRAAGAAGDPALLMRRQNSDDEALRIDSGRFGKRPAMPPFEGYASPSRSAAGPSRPPYGMRERDRPLEPIAVDDYSDDEDELGPAPGARPSSAGRPVVEVPTSDADSADYRAEAGAPLRRARAPQANAATAGVRYADEPPRSAMLHPPAAAYAPAGPRPFASGADLPASFAVPPYPPGPPFGGYNFNLAGPQLPAMTGAGAMPPVALAQMPLLSALLSNMQVAPVRPYLSTPAAPVQAGAQRTLFDHSAPRPGIPQGVGYMLRPIKNLHLDALLQTHPVVLPDPQRPDLLPISPELLEQYVRAAKRGDRPHEDLKNIGIMLYVMKTINQEAVNTAEINLARKNEDPLAFRHRETDARRIALVYQALVAKEHQILPVMDIRSHWDQEPRFVAFFDGIVAPDQVQHSRQCLLTAIGIALADEAPVEAFLEALPFWQRYTQEQIDNAADAWRKKYPGN